MDRPGAILTIGVYGFDEAKWFRRIVESGTDLFCDIRARRGLRGSEYAFANSARLQAKLAALGVPYRHLPSLAPSESVRARQREADREAGVQKRIREELGEAYRTGYYEECLSDFDASAFAREQLAGARRPLFFCVERSPAACHRSLLAESLATGLRLPVEHLMP
jgi:uncharacterized protein (DUF488 family)